MDILRTAADMAAWSRARRLRGERVALVPTMGFLHDGHRALMREARRRAEAIVVSVFVNPIQFNSAQDLETYPRDEAADLRACEAEGVGAVYLPSAAGMYREGFQSFVEVTELSQPLCGRTRPGHFRGVTTVVAKLFNAVQPDVAIFGEKDFQQLAVLRRMVRDLDFPIEIIGHPIVREADGLALSSRNARLSTEARGRALALPRALEAAMRTYAEGEHAVDRLLAVAATVLAQGNPEAVDYLEIVEAESLRPAASPLTVPARLAAAATFGGVRLIDNRPLA